MEARDYQRLVSRLTSEVTRALFKACEDGMSIKTACGIVASVADVTHAASGKNHGGSIGDIVKTVETAAMVRYRAGIM